MSAAKETTVSHFSESCT